MNKAYEREVSCHCGQVILTMAGRPILTSSCYCSDCQSAGAALQSLPDVPALLEADGGTPYVLYRKDRVHCVQGDTLLEGHRLAPESPTRRVVAACCQSALYLEFTKGHWLSMYRHRMPVEDRPPLQMRVMMGAKPDSALEKSRRGVPAYASYPLRFIWKLMAAWAAMGFRNPTLPWAVREASVVEARVGG